MTTDIIELNDFIVLIEQSNTSKTIIQKCEIEGDALGFAFYGSGNVELEIKHNDHITSDIEKVLGRKPKDFTTYAEQSAKSGVWDITQ